MSPSKKRKLLMICPYLPRLSQSGGQRSSYYSIKYLAPKNEITLICFSRDNEGLDEIKKYCRKVIVVKRGKTWDLKKILISIFGPYPFLVVNYISKELRKVIKDELKKEKFDLIHCDCFYPMPNIPKTKVPILLVDLTIEYSVYQHYIESLQGWKKLLAPFLWIDVLKLKYWEIHYWKHSDAVAAFGKDDQKVISKTTGRRDIQYFQNGVDKKDLNPSVKTEKSRYPTILFGVSNMKWMQNTESVNLILNKYWPEIKARIPNCKLYIVGRHAPEVFKEYSSTDIIVTEAEDNEKPKNPQYYYQYCWILLAPMGSGGGTRNKFLEAMALSLPAVTTPEGMGGIEVINHKHAIVCPPEEIVSNVINLIENHSYRKKMGISAKKLMKSNYLFEKSVESLNDIYDQITRNKEV